MEVSDGQEIFLAILEPTFLGEGLTLGAVTVAAGVVAGQLVATGIAAIQMAAEGRGTTAFDERHHLRPIGGERMLGSGARAPEAEDIGYLEAGAGPPGGAGGGGGG